MLDLAHIVGLEHARRALEVAASGRHSLALIGPPGGGKSVLARALSGLLPPLEEEEYQELVRCWRALGKATPPALARRQRFMAIPVPTVSPHYLIGNGEEGQETISVLARHGVLCLDRLDRFSPDVISLLPTLFDRPEWEGLQLVVTLEPCPCGYNGDPGRECVCTREFVEAHQRRVAGVLERIAITVEIPRIDAERLTDRRSHETSAQVRARVLAAVATARARQKEAEGLFNAFLSPSAIPRVCQPDAPGEVLFKAAIQQLHLSVGASHRVLCVARTIADLANSQQIQANHLAEALQYRPRV